MLHAYADGKGLGLHPDTPLPQTTTGIIGTLSHGHNQVIGSNFLLMVNDDPDDLIPAHQKIGNSRRKPHLTT